MSLKSLVFAIFLIVCSFNYSYTFAIKDELNILTKGVKYFCPGMDPSNPYQKKPTRAVKCGIKKMGVFFAYPMNYLPGPITEVCGYKIIFKKDEYGRPLQVVKFRTYNNQCEACNLGVTLSFSGKCPKV